MRRSQRLQRILKLADTAREQASMRVADSRRARDEGQDKLTQFEAYRREYQNQLSVSNSTLSSVQIRELRRFIAQIDSAISVLQQQSSRSEAQYRADISHWQAESRRTQTLTDMMNRARDEDRTSIERTSQHEIDERSGFQRTPR